MLGRAVSTRKLFSGRRSDALSTLRHRGSRSTDALHPVRELSAESTEEELVAGIYPKEEPEEMVPSPSREELSCATTSSIRTVAGRRRGWWKTDDLHEGDGGEMLGDHGVSGFMVVAKPGKEMYECAWLALQSLVIQICILWHIYKALIPRPERASGESSFYALLLFAIALHFMNVVMDMPFCLKILRNFPRMMGSLYHNCGRRLTCWDLLLRYVFFCMDAFVIPLTTLVLGALYLCTSETPIDVILNSCAVHFVTSIDNYMLGLYYRMFRLQGRHVTGKIHVAKMKSSASFFMNSIVYLPWLPLSFSGFSIWYGVSILQL